MAYVIPIHIPPSCTCTDHGQAQKSDERGRRGTSKVSEERIERKTWAKGKGWNDQLEGPTTASLLSSSSFTN